MVNQVQKAQHVESSPYVQRVFKNKFHKAPPGRDMIYACKKESYVLQKLERIHAVYIHSARRSAVKAIKELAELQQFFLA
jgi:hypothetical protein